jgi:protein-disulfide isomerase
MLLKLALVFAAVASQQVVPIPKTPDAFVLGPTTSDTVLECFFDHICGDCARSFPGFWEFYNMHSDRIQLRIHIFPLTYHVYGFVVA